MWRRISAVLLLTSYCCAFVRSAQLIGPQQAEFSAGQRLILIERRQPMAQRGAWVYKGTDTDRDAEGKKFSHFSADFEWERKSKNKKKWEEKGKTKTNKKHSFFRGFSFNFSSFPVFFCPSSHPVHKKKGLFSCFAIQINHLALYLFVVTKCFFKRKKAAKICFSFFVTSITFPVFSLFWAYFCSNSHISLFCY